MAINPITALSDQLQKLINEHGSATILRDHLALFKDQVVLLEKKAISLESENLDLKDKLEKTKQELEKLKKDNEKLKMDVQKYQQPSTSDLEEVKVNILLFLSKHEDAHAQNISSALNIGLQTTQFHLEELEEAEMVNASYFMGGETEWFLAQGGRRYLVRNNLIT